MKLGRVLNVLMVEDNSADAFLAQEAFKESSHRLKLHVVSDGEKGLNFLKRKPPFEDAPRPDLILLDLNLPRRSGKEVLTDIKADSELCSVPVVVWTTSKAPGDVGDSYSLHANAYMTKPVDLDAFYQLARNLVEFWFEVVTLPPAEKGDSFD